MAYVLVRHKVKDYKQWRKAFYGHLKEVKDNGSQGGFIFRNKNDTNEVFVLMKWDSLDNFKKFSKSKRSEEAKKKGGLVGKPEGWLFEEVEEVRE